MLRGLEHLDGLTHSLSQYIEPVVGPTYADAYFSPCGAYRYLLSRGWDLDLPAALIVMLNPSTATGLEDDPTITNCIRWAAYNDFGGIVVVNLFAYCATDPRVMKAAADPVGPLNDRVIAGEADAAHTIICAWSAHGGLLNRGYTVAQTLLKQQKPLHVWGLTNHGHPRHPLFMAKARKLVLWPEVQAYVRTLDAPKRRGA